MPLKT